MVGARSLAMALNRLIDARIDAANPRTAGRELPSGALTIGACSRSAWPRSLVFLVAVWQLDPVVRWLWPIPVAAFVIYPYLKRFTWLCHLWLGAVDGLAPVGAWVAITGNAPVGGVGARRRRRDLGRRVRPLLLALRRRDRPRAGAPLVGGALRRARRLPRARGCMHLATVALLVAAGLGLSVDWWYWAGVVAVAGPARLRALARAARRPAPARRGVLHDERRDQRRVLRVRARRRSRRPRYRWRVVTATQALEALRREARPRTRSTSSLDAGGFLLVTGPNGSGKTTLLRVLAGLDAPTAGELAAPGPRRDRLSRPRAARLPRADAAREPPPVRRASTASPSGPSGSGCCSSASASGRCATSASRRSRAECGSGSGSAACCCTSRSSCSSTSRSTRSTTPARRCSTRRSTSCARGARVIVATHDPGRVERLATQRLAFA